MAEAATLMDDVCAGAAAGSAGAQAADPPDGGFAAPEAVAHLLDSSLAGESFIAIHMTWGAINEWTTQASYARLSARAQHPLLSELLKRMRQEGRHIDFYARKRSVALKATGAPSA